MKKLVVVCLVLAALLLFGCQQVAENAMDEQEANEMEVEAEAEVDVDVTAPSVDLSDWCQTGAEWQWSGEVAGQGANAEWRIDGMVESGEFAGLCHVVYTAETAEGPSSIDYYFNQDGSEGYVKMVVNGQTYTQEWHGQQ